MEAQGSFSLHQQEVNIILLPSWEYCSAPLRDKCGAQLSPSMGCSTSHRSCAGCTATEQPPLIPMVVSLQGSSFSFFPEPPHTSSAFSIQKTSAWLQSGSWNQPGAALSQKRGAELPVEGAKEALQTDHTGMLSPNTLPPPPETDGSEKSLGHRWDLCI